MKDFWKNEWKLFLNDMQELGEFFLQPIEITGIPGKSDVKMLKPTVEEAKEKANEGGFWSREWKSFLSDMESLGEFCLQPIEITFPGKKDKQINSCGNQEGFWSNEWNLFKEDMKNVKEFFTQPVDFK